MVSRPNPPLARANALLSSSRFTPEGNHWRQFVVVVDVDAAVADPGAWESSRAAPGAFS